MELKVHNLFPTPVVESNIQRSFTEKELEYINNCQYDFLKNEGNITSRNRYVLDSPELKDIKKFIENEIEIYIKNILIPNTEIKPYITQSWLNYTKPGEYHHKHSHPNSFISGVLYIKADSSRDKIIFLIPDDRLYILKLNTDNFQTYNSTSWWLPSEPGKMYIFPSKLQHEVSITETQETRISLAFNTFLKGNIGSEFEITRLNI